MARARIVETTRALVVRREVSASWLPSSCRWWPSWPSACPYRLSSWLSTCRCRWPSWPSSWRRRSPSWPSACPSRWPSWPSSWRPRSPSSPSACPSRWPSWPSSWRRRSPSSPSACPSRWPSWPSTCRCRWPSWPSACSYRLPSWRWTLCPVVFLAVFLAVAVARLAVFLAPEAVAAATLGSFFWPDTTAFSSAPARNFGTAVFFARTRSPVRGFRTIRAGRTFFSNAPKPVMATFSPRATSRAIVSSTASSASDAAFLLPSKLSASLSMNWDLFTGFPFVNAVEPAPDLPRTVRTSCPGDNVNTPNPCTAMERLSRLNRAQMGRTEGARAPGSRQLGRPIVNPR